MYAPPVLKPPWCAWLGLWITCANGDAIIETLQPSSDKLYEQSVSKVYKTTRRSRDFGGRGRQRGSLTFGNKVQPAYERKLVVDMTHHNSTYL